MNSQHSAPITNRPANNQKGTFQLPSHFTEYPTTGWLRMAAIWPEVFIVAATVAECPRPMSTQVLHAGAVVNMQVAAASEMNTAAWTGWVAKLASRMNT